MGPFARLVLVAVSVSLLGASCRPVAEDTASEFAAAAGHPTMLIGVDDRSGVALGGCQRALDLGWSSCLLERGSSLPVLNLYFTNPAEYAIGDCGGGIFRAGSGGPGLITVDLSPLSDQANRLGMCLLKVEAVEKYPDNRDSGQFHSIPITGGLFIEMLRPGFQPVPADPVVGWCYKVKRTTKGRTKIEKCN